LFGCGPDPLGLKGERVGLYERLLEEKRILEEADTEEDRERRKRLGRMTAYVERQKKVTPAGGYVTAEELREEKEKRMQELRMLEGFVIRGATGLASGYAFGALKSKYRTEYLQLCRIWGKWA
jgi:hypothetical protein